MYSCVKYLHHPSKWIAGVNMLEAFIFLSFLRKFKILFPFFFEVFGLTIYYVFDYVKNNSVLKMNFLLNIDTYPIPVININNNYNNYLYY